MFLVESTKVTTKPFHAHRDVVFYLYDSHDVNQTAYLIPLKDHDELLASPFDAQLDTRFLIHGWYDDVRSKISTQLRAAYALHPQRLNIVVVDWGRGARTLNYFLAKSRVAPVGKAVAAFVDFVCNATAQRPDQIGFVGHSLGAHVAGVGGKNVRSGQIASIVGLDAALPLFWYDRFDERLDSGDAQYVEGIHTNVGFKGYSRPLGHADFYPNWGNRQPGCGLDLGRSCSHWRAIALFADSVTAAAVDGHRPMVGIQCAKGWEELMDRECTANGTATMGGEPVRAGGKSGAFYVATNGRRPFAKP